MISKVSARKIDRRPRGLIEVISTLSAWKRDPRFPILIPISIFFTIPDSDSHFNFFWFPIPIPIPKIEKTWFPNDSRFRKKIYWESNDSRFRFRFPKKWFFMILIIPNSENESELPNSAVSALNRLRFILFSRRKLKFKK